LYNYDLDYFDQLLKAGAYQEAEKARKYGAAGEEPGSGAVEQAQALQAQAQRAGSAYLAVQARLALESADYARHRSGGQAQAKYAELGDERFKADLELYQQRYARPWSCKSSNH
jgi:hypothetical protein